MLKLCTHAKIWTKTTEGFNLLEEDFFTVSLNRPQALHQLETHLDDIFGQFNWAFVESPWFEVVDTNKKTAQSANSERSNSL